MRTSSDAALVDGEARRRIATELDRTFVVEAAAGTGKTTALVSRMVETLAKGRARLERMVAVTFTERAAGEMKLRLRAALESALGDAEDADRGRLSQALAELELAPIATIHSFCGDILREHPLDAAVDPSFEVLSDGEQSAVVEEVFDRWFQQALEAPPEGLRRFLRRSRAPQKQLMGACLDLIERRDYPAPLRRIPLQRAAAIDRIIDHGREVASYARRAANRRDPLCRSLEAVRRWLTDADARERLRPRDYDAHEGHLAELQREYAWRLNGRGTFFAPELPRVQVQSRRDELKAEIDELLKNADADLAAALQTALWPVVEAYEAEKARRGLLDFLDLLLRVRGLLAGPARGPLQERYDRLFVDEFQDTDPLQSEILLLLASRDPEEDDPSRVRVEPGKLFVVGDPKQSIYRFRRAEVATYEAVKEQLVADGGVHLELRTSFRSVPAIQSLINTAFEPWMQGAEDGTQARYVSLAGVRAPIAGQPAVIALPVPEPMSDRGQVTQRAVEDSTPEGVASFVEWLLRDSGWRVSDPGTGETVPVESRHVCLLFRRMRSFGRDVTRPYMRALEARRIPRVLVGGSSFYAREEVLALRAALAAIEWPSDDLHVYATLRGPLFAFDDAVLLEYREDVGPLRAFAPEEAEAHLEPVADALRFLGELHRGRNRRPIADTLGRLLDGTRAHASVAHWPSGEQALANIARLLDDARRFEERSATSFRAFVEHLEDSAERGSGGQAPMVEESAEGVRVMTVHVAKGLEFPVVVLADPTAKRTNTRPSRFIDREAGLWAAPIAGLVPAELDEQREAILAADDAEEIRIGYVAATRARDLLVVPVVGEERFSGWVDVLHEALYPAREERRAGEAIEGCPRFGEDSLAARPVASRSGPRDSVKPGYYASLAGGGGAVWWDPSSLALGKVVAGGVQRSYLLEETPQSGGALAAHDAWASRRSVTLEGASTPSRRVRTVTEVAKGVEALSSPALEAVTVERTDAPRPGRPRGARFGTLVHGVLAEVDLTLEAAEPPVRSMARSLARALGAPPAEVDAAVDAVLSALRHPVMRRAAKSSDCRRESQILIPGPEGEIVEGVIDLAFAEDGAWTIVDYKTDEGGDDPGYRRQVAMYADAVAASTGQPASGILLLV